MSPRILYVQDAHPNGSETFVRAEINCLYRRGYDVWVTSSRLIPQFLGECLYRDRILSRQNTSENLKEIILQLKPDYIHTHFVTESVRTAAPVAQALGVPFGFTAHAYDIWKRHSRIEPEVINQIANNPLFVTCAVEGTRHLDYMVCCGVPDDKLVITPNTVSKDILPTRRQEPPKSTVNLLMVGRAVEKKGFMVAVDAVRLLRLNGHRVNLRIIGGGDSGRQLGQLLLEYASVLPFLTVEPMLDHATVLEVMKESDALLMPSIIAEDGDSDGIPTVLMEAMLLGVPVITTDVGSITDLVRDEDTGLIARSGDPASLAHRILDLNQLLQDREKAQKLSDRAFAEASSKDIEASVDALLGHLQKAMPKNFSQAPTTKSKSEVHGRYCPVCEQESPVFLPYGVTPRPNAMCPHCNSLERHRFTWHFLKTQTNLLETSGISFLHIAPEPFYERLLKPRIGLGYLTADIANPQAMVKMDLTDIEYADETFDVIYCSHVLEHIPDDRKAMREMRRVLKRSGWAIILVPTSGQSTEEDLTITDPQKRQQLYGQPDHVRYYGLDVVDRLRESGFEVKMINASDILEDAEIERMGIGSSAQNLFYCVRVP